MCESVCMILLKSVMNRIFLVAYSICIGIKSQQIILIFIEKKLPIRNMFYLLEENYFVKKLSDYIVYWKYIYELIYKVPFCPVSKAQTAITVYSIPSDHVKGSKSLFQFYFKVALWVLDIKMWIAQKIGWIEIPQATT